MHLENVDIYVLYYLARGLLWTFLMSELNKNEEHFYDSGLYNSYPPSYTGKNCLMAKTAYIIYICFINFVTRINYNCVDSDDKLHGQCSLVTITIISDTLCQPERDQQEQLKHGSWYYCTTIVNV